MGEILDNFQLLENKFLTWAQEEAGIRAAFILGSRARNGHPADESSDLDITILVIDPDLYLKDACWLENIGHPWLTFIEGTGTGPFFERRVLFEGGYDVDFAGELWTAISCSNSYMKWRLLTMMEWQARAVHGSTYDTWHSGRFLEEWADQRAIRELRDAFSIYDSASVWSGLFSTMKLFHWLAVETADRLNIAYPIAGEAHAVQLVQEIFQRNA